MLYLGDTETGQPFHGFCQRGTSDSRTAEIGLTNPANGNWNGKN
jgi:hypothetical protein